MDTTTTIFDLKKAVKNFCDQRDWQKFHNAKDLAIGISTEANELLEIFRFKCDDQLENVILSKKPQIEDELADSLYFILRFADLYNIDLSIALRNKIKKNSEKYPISEYKGSNKKYND